MVHIENSHELLIKHETKDLIKVVIESRFASDSTKGLLINKKFTLACMRDCFLRGEAPYASHVLYAQSHIVDDFVASERALGMHAGFLWGDCATKTVVYTDMGISSGMAMGIEHAKKMNRPIEYRVLGFIPEVTDEEVELTEKLIEQQKVFLQECKTKLHPTFNLCLSNIY